MIKLAQERASEVTQKGQVILEETKSKVTKAKKPEEPSI
jgi:hypothetical protein